MEKGHNSDIHYKGKSFHIQTEDWGSKNPYFVSSIFSGGALVKSFKTKYEEVLPQESLSSPKAIQLALRVQHQKILDLLLSGKLL